MPLGGILFISIFVALFGIFLLYLASLLGVKPKAGQVEDSVKYETYECGIQYEEKKDTKVSVKFYLTAILFIVFDIEIIFLYPWATSFRSFISSGEGLLALISMGFFLLVFIFGLFWEIKSKALEWE